MRLRNVSILTTAGLLTLWVAATPASQQQAQTPVTPKKQASKSKPKKIWTEDDLKALRKPWDEYERKKAEEAARAEAEAKVPKKEEPAAAAASSEKESDEERPFVPPKTLEEGEQRLAQKEQEIEGLKELIEHSREDLLNESDETARGAIQKKLDQSEKRLAQAERELELLEKSVAELRKLAAEEKPPLSADLPPVLR